MRTLNLLLAAAALSLTAVPSGAAGQSLQSPHALSVSLAMPLSSVTARNGQVTYVWFVPKGPPGPAAQDLTSYDKHMVRIALTPTGKAWLMAWTRRYHVFSFASRYAPAQPRSYGSAFVTRLTVQKSGRTMAKHLGRNEPCEGTRSGSRGAGGMGATGNRWTLKMRPHS